LESELENLLLNPQAIVNEDEKEEQNEIIEDLIDKAKALIIDKVEI